VNASTSLEVATIRNCPAWVVHPPMRDRSRHSSFSAWLHRQPFLVRWGVLLVAQFAVYASVVGVLAVFGQSVHWTFLIMWSVSFSLFGALVNRAPRREPYAWVHRRFPRVYAYFKGFSQRPNPRLSRFKSPGSDD
jgi:hypothetical protein